MKKIELAMLLGMIITIILTGITSFADEYNGITDSVFRLHILANSDSEEDQVLKLKVRDEILSQTSYIFEGKHSAEEAKIIAKENLEEIKRIAKKTITDNGYSYNVECEVTDMYFNTRIYDGITMPQGVYKALRITIGEAEGKNWWCVMFPPLCLPAVTSIDDVLADYSDVFTEEEIDMLQNPQKYEARFFLVELYYKIKETLK